SLYDVRLLLHGHLGHLAHDWASIVVYEAFPTNLDEQLEDLRYYQAKRAQDGALERLEALVTACRHAVTTPAETADTFLGEATAGATQKMYDACALDANDAGTRLPDAGSYAIECAGLRAAGNKRLAQAALQIAVRLRPTHEWRDVLLNECFQRLDQARTEY